MQARIPCFFVHDSEPFWGRWLATIIVCRMPPDGCLGRISLFLVIGFHVTLRIRLSRSHVSDHLHPGPSPPEGGPQQRLTMRNEIQHFFPASEVACPLSTYCFGNEAWFVLHSRWMSRGSRRALTADDGRWMAVARSADPEEIAYQHRIVRLIFHARGSFGDFGSASRIRQHSGCRESQSDEGRNTSIRSVPGAPRNWKMAERASGLVTHRLHGLFPIRVPFQIFATNLQSREEEDGATFENEQDEARTARAADKGRKRSGTAGAEWGDTARSITHLGTSVFVAGSRRQ